jgi:hypothetical protein
MRPGGWDEDVGYGAGEVGKPAFIVVTSSPPESGSGMDWAPGHRCSPAERRARCRGGT